jgi:O-antigen/teichoic acid export membrane protein
MTILAVALYGLALPLAGLGSTVGTLATLLRDPGLLRWSQGCLAVAFTATAGYFALEGYASWAVVFAAAAVLFAWLWWRQRKSRDRAPRAYGCKSLARLADLAARARDAARPGPILRPAPEVAW